MNHLTRRNLLALAALPLALSLPTARAAAPRHAFAPKPGDWRTFELTTRIEIQDARGASQLWLPLPSIDSDYQQPLQDSWSGNASAARVVALPNADAKLLQAEFAAATRHPALQLVSRVRTQSRAVDWSRPGATTLDAAAVQRWTRPTELLPTDGIVLDTAREAPRGAHGDVEQARHIYDWIVAHTYREPEVRGCGVGDIKTMLETGNFGGKCGDINGLFVGLCRALGMPARDLYGIRLAPSAFGYGQLGADPAKLQGAQHCRAEVFLQGHGWVAMDPADVGKVMRMETPVWIKDARNPLIAPLDRELFGAWEGNWVAFNDAHDVSLPGSQGAKLGFLMYPQAENANGRYDALDPDHFRYTIAWREPTA